MEHFRVEAGVGVVAEVPGVAVRGIAVMSLEYAAVRAALLAVRVFTVAVSCALASMRRARVGWSGMAAAARESR